MKKYKVMTIKSDYETCEFDLRTVNQLLDDGWQIQDVRLTSAGSKYSKSAWQTFVLYKEG